ncbi:TetR/AcrR family transcriptional regulator [Luteibacter aegosomatissinici]|uniref:TetR/AcrR family transcriptional regulator n=1 Tax=Luteibacter aegosomatissinici TaxID=2911539 RepID=UPI001FF877AE|nr:TetR family transcriptional regulator [Luteibacter aegosomatissinici]UPG92571.1 TetR family transcriptional regulator [Luteibacter aegosomatissinici]
MPTKPKTPVRRSESLSRERIVEASIALLDSLGETGLTFRALSERLATGAGAIYWHIADKDDLLVAASDATIAGVLAASADARSPEAKVRAMGLALFDAIDRRPWLGSALARAPGQLPVVRIMEGLGQQVIALGVPPRARWATTNALLSFILGVGGQNAANTAFATTREIDREAFLGEMAGTWAALDAEAFPFTRSIASQLPRHDDRADFLAGLNLLLAGIQAQWPR